MLEPKKKMEWGEDWVEGQKTWVLGPILPLTGFLLNLNFFIWERRSLGIIRTSQTVYLEVLGFHDLG